MPKILVTGCAGFIGFHLTQALLARSDEVVGIDNMSDYYDVNLKTSRLDQVRDQIDFYQEDISDSKSLDRIFSEHKIDKVVNLAAQAGVRYSIENPRAYIESNIVGFTNILESCRHHEVQHLVYASSSSVYGANRKLPFSVHDNVDHPLSLYAATKKSNELMAHTYSNLFQLPTTGLRFFTVYGPWGRPDMALFKFTKAILAGEPIQIFNYGHHRRDFTYVDDIVEGIIRVLDQNAKPNMDWNPEHPDPGTSFAPWRVYNIGNNHPVELLQYIDLIEKRLDKKAIRELLPLQPGDVPDTYADVKDLIKDVNYKPETPIEKGINSFIDWYLSYYA